MEPHSVARKGRAGSGRTARLGSHRHPREKSSAPPWSKPLLTSNQPWAQKRNAATTANPTQSGQWGRPMQIIRLPQLDGAGPPGANPWRESRQFCTSPVPSAPCCRLSVSRRSRQQGRQSAPDWQRWLGPGGAGAARTVIPTEVVPRKAGSGNGGSNPLLAGNHSRDRPAWAGLCYGWWAWPDRGGCCPRRCHGPTRQRRTIPDLGQPIEQLSHFQFHESGNDAGGGHGMRWEVFSSFPLRNRGDQAGISCGACGGDVPVTFSYLP